MRSPGLMKKPMSIGIAMTWPDAVFDLTSTTLIGSMTPVASAVTMMSRRWMVAVWIGTVFAVDDVQPTAAMSARYRILRFTANSGWRLLDAECGRGMRDAVALLQVAADEGLDVGFRGACVQARLNQVETGEVERGLGGSDVHLQGRADVVALRLDAEILDRGLDLQQLQRDGLLRGLVVHEIRREVLLREELRVAQVRLRVVFGYPGQDERLLARIVVEDVVRGGNAESRAGRRRTTTAFESLGGLGVLAVVGAGVDLWVVAGRRRLVRRLRGRVLRRRRPHRRPLERHLRQCARIDVHAADVGRVRRDRRHHDGRRHEPRERGV